MEISQKLNRIRVKAIKARSATEFWNNLTEPQKLSAKAAVDPTGDQGTLEVEDPELRDFKEAAWKHFRDMKPEKEK
jgi:hypothetical protein